MNPWLKGLLIGLLLAPLPAAVSAIEIIIVKSSDNSYFNQSIETLVDQVDQAARFKVTTVAGLHEPAPETGNRRFYIGLGLPAARAIGKLAAPHLAINAYLTHEQYRQLEPENQVSVLLDQPLYRYLAFCKLLLAIDSIGVISGQPLELGEAEKQILAERNFSLNQYRIDEQNKLLPVLRRLMQQNDALLMLPRSAIYNRDTLKGVLLTSYRFRKPAISYSPAHVRAGALASIYSSPEDIGRHLASLINRQLGKSASPLPAYEYARYYTIAINAEIARALNLELPGEREIRGRMEHIEP